MKEQGAEKKEVIKKYHKETGCYTTEKSYEFAKWYHQHRLNAITDEDIEEMFPEIPDEPSVNILVWWEREAAKALLNHLKGIQ